jgi:hypothetical protein
MSISATIAPELIIHSEFGGSFWTSPSFIVTTAVAVVLSAAVGVGFAFYRRRDFFRGDCHNTKAPGYVMLLHSIKYLCIVY